MAGSVPKPASGVVLIGLPNVNLWGLTVALLLAEILNVVQVFTPETRVGLAVTVLLLLLLLFSGQQAENGKKPG